MFKFSNKDTRTTPCSSVSVVNFEQVNADWPGSTCVRNSEKQSVVELIS